MGYQSNGSETGSWPCPCGYDLTAGGIPCGDSCAAPMDDLDAPPERLPDPPEWMVGEALAWEDGRG